MKIIFMNNIGVNIDSANLMSFYEVKKYYEYEVWDLSEIYGYSNIVENIEEAISISSLEKFEERLLKVGKQSQIVIITNMTENPWSKIAAYSKKYFIPVINTQKNSFTEILDKKIAFDFSIKVPIKSRIRRILQSIRFTRVILEKTKKNLVVYDYQISSYNSKPETVKNFIRSHNMKYDEYLKNRISDNPMEKKYILFIDGSLCDHPIDFSKGDPSFNSKHYLKQLNEYFDGLEQNTNLPVVVSLHPISVNNMTSKDFGNRKTTYGITPQLIQHAEFTVSHYSTSLINVVLADKPALIISSNEIENSLRYRWQVLAIAFAKICGFSIDTMDNPAYLLPTVNFEKYNEFKMKYIVNKEKLDMKNSEIILELLSELDKNVV